MKSGSEKVPGALSLPPSGSWVRNTRSIAASNMLGRELAGSRRTDWLRLSGEGETYQESGPGSRTVAAPGRAATESQNSLRGCPPQMPWAWPHEVIDLAPVLRRAITPECPEKCEVPRANLDSEFVLLRFMKGVD